MNQRVLEAEATSILTDNSAHRKSISQHALQSHYNTRRFDVAS
jgi:hypothetical protein